MTETIEIRKKRLKMRSMRRGIKEMDMILSAFAERALPAMSESELDLYEAMLSENDHDLYRWVSGQTTPPERFAALLNDAAQMFQKQQ